jgi:hypothetical protein
MITTIGIGISKNTFYPMGLDQPDNIVSRLKTSRERLERRLANIPRCLIGMEACSGSREIGRQLETLGHDVRLIPAQYVKPFLKGYKNDYRDAEAIEERKKSCECRAIRARYPSLWRARRDSNSRPPDSKSGGLSETLAAFLEMICWPILGNRYKAVAPVAYLLQCAIIGRRCSINFER